VSVSHAPRSFFPIGLWLRTGKFYDSRRSWSALAIIIKDVEFLSSYCPSITRNRRSLAFRLGKNPVGTNDGDHSGSHQEKYPTFAFVSGLKGRQFHNNNPSALGWLIPKEYGQHFAQRALFQFLTRLFNRWS
jgi:hypothetical protein